MARLAAIILGGTLVLCVACGTLVYLFWNHEQTVVAQKVANVIATQVADNFGTSALETDQIVLTEDDLDVNTSIALDGSCGFNVTGGDAEIYGVTTEITPSKIAFGCAGESMYSAIPVVHDGRVELTKFKTSSIITEIIFSKGKLKMGVEKGINDALAAKGVKPVGITLERGSMTILTEGAAI
jgi:hypothetical protein